GNGQTLSAQFTPADSADYNNAVANAQINITAAGPATLISTSTLARASSVVVTLTIANTGGSTATNVRVNSAAIGSAATTTTLPVVAPNIPAGGTAVVTLAFPLSVGTSGSKAVLATNGTYTG